jgi:ribonuclease P protein component
MTVLALPNALDRDRLGLIASRKLGGAVTRNRAKRRLRSLFRETDPDTARARGYVPLDIVIVPRRQLLGASFEVLRRELSSALARLDRTRRS